MFRKLACAVSLVLLAAMFNSASAQTASTDAKPSKLKLTAEKLKEMKARWSSNRPKLAACRKDVKAKGLAGDDRWFYIEDCMSKT